LPRTPFTTDVPTAWRGAADAEFATRHRLVAYSSAVCFAYVCAAVALWLGGAWPYDRDGFPAVVDFLGVWSAGRMALEGQAAAVYDWALHQRVEARTIGRDIAEYFGWHYPPTFLLVAAPFAALPYVPAWMAWIAFGLAAMAACVRLIRPGAAFVLAALAAPSTLFCAMIGQNGFLTAGLVAGAFATLDRRPWCSGVFIGLLTYKPHFGVLIPLALLLTRRWSAFAAAALTASALVAASALVFGADVWAAFFQSASATVNDNLRKGSSDWSKLQSVFSLFQQTGGGEGFAWAMHLALAAAAAAAALRTWMGDTTTEVRAAALIAASFLATPYAYIYDSVVLTVGALFLLADATDRGFRPFDKVLLALCCLLPALFQVVGSVAAPSAAALLLCLAVRRAGPASVRYGRAGYALPGAL